MNKQKHMAVLVEGTESGIDKLNKLFDMGWEVYTTECLPNYGGSGQGAVFVVLTADCGNE